MCSHSRQLGCYVKACDGCATTLPTGHTTWGYMQEGFHDSDGVAFEVCLDCGRVEHFIRFDLGELNESVKRETKALAARSRRREKELAARRRKKKKEAERAAGDPPDDDPSDAPSDDPRDDPSDDPSEGPSPGASNACVAAAPGPEPPGASAR